MRRSSATAIAAAFALHALSVSAADNNAPYLGHWSNGRGETLVIKKETIDFAGNLTVRYRDVTRVTDGDTFELEIVAPATMPGSGGKTLAVHCETDSMHMTSYASHASFMKGGDVLSEVQWERDAARAAR